MTIITDHGMPRGCAISGYLMCKTRENQQSKVYYGTNSYFLAVATVFIGLWPVIFTFYSQGGGAAYTRDKTTYAGT